LHQSPMVVNTYVSVSFASYVVINFQLLRTDASARVSPGSVVANLVADIIQHLLDKKSLPFSKEIIAAFLFTCRQLYSSPEVFKLFVLRSLSRHQGSSRFEAVSTECIVLQSSSSI
jgi:hypothetical protein